MNKTRVVEAKWGQWNQNWLIVPKFPVHRIPKIMFFWLECHEKILVWNVSIWVRWPCSFFLYWCKSLLFNKVYLTKSSFNFSGTTVLVSYQPLLKVPWLLTVWSFNTWASIWWTKRLWKKSSKPNPRSKLTTRKILIAAAPEVQQLPHYPKPEIVLKMENLKANLRKNVKHSCLLLDSRPLRNRNWSNDDPVRKVVKAWIYFHVEIPPNLPWPKTRQITTISLPIWSRPAITLSHLDAEMKLK